MPNPTLLSRFFSPAGTGWIRAWRNPHNKRFWLLLAISFYTLIGFVLAPWIIQNQVIPRIAKQLSRSFSIDELRINPWVLSIEASGFQLAEANGARLLGFDRLYINFQLSSLFRRAWTFREIRLEKPFVAFTHDAPGDTNFGRLLADVATADTNRVAEKSDLVRLLIHELAISDGAVELTDFVPKPKVSTRFAPINIDIKNLSTLPGEAGQQRVLITTEPNGRVEWSGEFQLNPLLATGHLEGGGRYLPVMYRYIENQVTFEVSEGQAEFAFDYKIAATDDEKIAAQIDGLDFHLRGIVMRTNDPELEFLNLPELSLTGGQFLWPEQTVRVGGLTIDGAQLHVIRNPDGLFNLQQLVLPTDEPATIEPDGVPAIHPLQNWSINLDQLNIVDFGVAFEDQSLRGDAITTRAMVDIVVHDVSSSDGAQSPLRVDIDLETGGSVALEGEIGLLPTPHLNTTLKIDQLALQIAQPWVGDIARVDIDGGSLNADTRLEISADQPLTVSGSLSIDSLDVRDASKDERLIGWQRLTINQLIARAPGNSLEVSEASFTAPYIKVLIAEDQTTNFEQLIIESQTGTDEATANANIEIGPTDAPAVTIGQIAVTDGAADFTDLSLPLPFAAQIDKLQGRISTLSTVSREPAAIELDGQVGKYGLVTIAGQLLPSAPMDLSDIQLEFRNLAMPELSPYTVKFAGRSIDGGKLDVTLKYLIERGELLGENNIVIRDLVLGDKVDHPDATNLPLGLAVALLKRPDGTIDLELPVSGDVNDPDFSVGKLVFSVFANLITKAATSPFRLLGGLVGVDADSFDQIEFRPGRSGLTPPELEKLAKLTEALTMRTGLGLELRGTADPVADTASIQAERVESMIKMRLQTTGTEKADETMLTKRRRNILETLVREQLPDLDVAAIASESIRPKNPEKPDGKKTLDEPAYIAALESRLVAAESVSEQDLDELARLRAEAIKSAVLGDARLSAERVVIDPLRASVTITDNGWIPMRLELTAQPVTTD